MGLSKRVYNALYWHGGVSTIGQALALQRGKTQAEMLKQPGLGRKGLEELNSAIARLLFSSDPSVYHLRMQQAELLDKRNSLAQQIEEIDGYLAVLAEVLPLARAREEAPQD